MGCYHTKIHSCMTVHDEPDCVHGRMVHQNLTKSEASELAASIVLGDLANPADEMMPPLLKRCA